MVFQNVGLLCIIDNNMHLNFDMDLQGRQFMDKGPWYNTAILSQLNGHIFEDTTIFSQLNGHSFVDFSKQDASTGIN